LKVQTVQKLQKALASGINNYIVLMFVPNRFDKHTLAVREGRVFDGLGPKVNWSVPDVDWSTVSLPHVYYVCRDEHVEILASLHLKKGTECTEATITALVSNTTSTNKSSTSSSSSSNSDNCTTSTSSNSSS
jgi:hypothetical protein